MQQIADWLEELGMPEYGECFAENGIDVSVLRYLTDQDLEKIGVLLGHRRKMLAAIAELVGAVQAPPQPGLTESKPKDTAERRQVTVMFSDLVGSTALAGRMDPEDLREVISGYQKCVAQTVRRFGGFVAKYMGDGVLVYFGYPQAHEDDAERAVRAGLELIAAVGALEAASPLQTRVGIATGLVVVGDLIGSGDAQERGIVGETPNLAARLQGIAEPDTVVIAESTRKLLGNLFELQDLGAQDLKGIGGRVRAWAALRPASVESRFDALHANGLTELVGREEELELLLRRWSKVKVGEGQVVLLSGEAGIGKSRLTAALLERLAAEPHTRLRYFCSPQHTDSAFYPIISQMGRATKLAREGTSKERLDKLDAILAPTLTSIQDAALFAEMLSLSNDGRYPALELPPALRRQKTLEALISQVQRLSRQNPMLMIFEDVHWSDPTSLELLGRMVDRILSLRMLLIVTFRPEFAPPGIGQPQVTPLTINRLARQEAEALIDRIVGNKVLSANIRQDIIERTDGIPLFVEEMTKAVLEAGGEEAGERAVAAIPSSAMAVPPSLHASLMARLDRLGPAKELAQIGAAIGREFSQALLAAVTCKPEAELGSALDRLLEAGLLFRHGVPPDATYSFKHALVQDAAHGTLLREPRRSLHARIAKTVETQFPEVAESQPELLARHFKEAGLVEKAALFWGKAGQQSLARSALVEAVAQLTRALDQIAALPSTASLRREQIKLQIELTTALMHTQGHAALQTKTSLAQARSLIERAEALGEPPEDPLLLLSVLYGFWAENVFAFNGDICCDIAGQFLALAQKQGTTVPLMVGHRLMGTSLVVTGDPVQGRAHYDQALKLHDPSEAIVAVRFGQGAEATTLALRSRAQWFLGYPEAMLADTSRALSIAQSLGHAATLSFVLFHAALSHFLRGDYATANAQSEALSALAHEKGSLLWEPGAMLLQGTMLAQASNATNAVQMITSAITAWRRSGTTLWMPFYLCHLANIYAKISQFDDAWLRIREAMTLIETTKEMWFQPEVNRIVGEIAIKSPQPHRAKAKAYFERALAIARKQQAKSWELRAAMSMARLWRDQGKRDEARDLLAPVYGWFTEGLDTLDLKEAKALLDELAA
jgi:class 3 adenylate cyclase/tetratricopeptide (TPR) repeat protein